MVKELLIISSEEAVQLTLVFYQDFKRNSIIHQRAHQAQQLNFQKVNPH